MHIYTPAPLPVKAIAEVKSSMNVHFNIDNRKELFSIIYDFTITIVSLVIVYINNKVFYAISLLVLLGCRYVFDVFTSRAHAKQAGVASR